MAFTSVPSVARLRASVLSSLITELRPAYALKTVNETVSNSSTLQNDDELFVSVAASLTYKVELSILYEAGSAADYKWALTFPSGTFSYRFIHLTSGGSFTQLSSSSYTSGTGVSAGGAGIGTGIGLALVGVLVMGVTAGTLQYQWAQNTPTVENTATWAGSLMHLTRLT